MKVGAKTLRRNKDELYQIAFEEFWKNLIEKENASIETHFNQIKEFNDKWDKEHYKVLYVDFKRFKEEEV